MKILVTTFGADGGRSGISRYLVELLRAWDRMEGPVPEITVVCYEDEAGIFGAGLNRIRCLKVGSRLRHPVASIFWHQYALPGLVRRLGSDLVFFPAANRRASWNLPVPAVGTVHDFSSLHIKGKYDPARDFYIKHVLPAFIRRLDHVITVSDSSRRDILKRTGITPDRVSVIWNGAGREFFEVSGKRTEESRVREKYGLRQPYLFYLSRIEHPGKNHIRLIEAFEILSRSFGLSHELVFAGPDWSGAEAVHARAKSSPCRGSIHFLGFTDAADLPHLVRQAEVFVFPSLYEGFGIPVAEAMACGVPVACSNISSMPEIAGDAAVLFDPQRVEDIAEKTASLLKDGDLRKTYRRRGLERARLFSWDRAGAETLKILKTKAAEKRRPVCPQA